MPRTIARLLLSALLASAASAQLLKQGNGNLPSCGQSCAILTQAQSQCGGASNTDLSTWACFCKKVWGASNGDLTTMCDTSCSAPSDNTAVDTWYTQNCGSDNGASEHGGGGGSGNPGGASGSGSGATAKTSSVAGGSEPSTTANSGTVATGANEQDCATWWSCHWKWVVMIIVLAVGLLILGLGGRWLKKRHDRKRDANTESFNAGITTRGPPMTTADNPLHDAALAVPPDGRNSPSRTREAFMPYGYGYTRSESRLGNEGHGRGSPLARGGTPVNELEKSEADQTTGSRRKSKSRRVMVRERSDAGAPQSEKSGR